jgi:endo-1,3-1,4-beta-glycanase ExoK
MRKINLVFLTAFVSTTIPVHIGAQEAFIDSMNAYQSSKWSKADWANGSPFNCGWLPDHISFSDGKMVITLDNVPSHEKQYSAGEYRTVDDLNYGVVEARLKAVKCKGVATTFFLYSDSSRDEIDLEFLGQNTQQVQTNYFVGGNGGHEHFINLGFDVSSDYHVYKIEWAKTHIKWYIDGVEKYSVTGTTLPSHAMKCMLSLWNGIGVDGWMGAFNYSGPLNAYYDYFSYTPAGGSVGIRVVKNRSIGVTEPSIHLIDNALKISLALNERGPVSVNLFTLTGKTIARFNYNSYNAGNNVISIPMDGKVKSKNLSASSFICGVSSKNATASRKICFLK